MGCLQIFSDYCELYLDTENGCDKLNVCLVQLLGLEAMAEKVRHVGLDIVYPEQYNTIMETINNKENMNE